MPTHSKSHRRNRAHHQKNEPNKEDPTIATNMTTTDGSISTFNTRKTTESSNGRKIRQVLQKKQLDVLLHTFSNVLEENEDTQMAETDRWTLARKSSIEGNTFSRDQLSSRWEMSNDETDDEERSPNANIGRLRTNKSLISESDIDTEFDNDDYYVGEYDYREEREQNETRFSSSRGGMLAFDGSHAAHKPSKDPKSQGRSKRSTQKRMDFSTRLTQAGEVLKEFTAKTTQKHREIAEDFQEASVKLRSHLKSGADILFEDISEHFDEVVQKLFVDGNDQRDDERNSCGQQSSQRDRGNGDAHQGEPLGVGSKERFLTHEETLRAMNQQVVGLLEPVEKTLQAYSKELVNCVSPFEEDEYMTPISKEMVAQNSAESQRKRHLSSN